MLSPLSALVGTAREVEEAAYWVRRSGVLVIAGTIFEVVGAGMVLKGSLLGGVLPSVLVSALGGALGVAVLLRLGGGVAMIVGAEVASTPFAPIEGKSAERTGTSPVAGYPATLTAERASLDYRLDLRRSIVALGGVAAVAVSYLFDGHTVTASPTWLVRVAYVAHVVGAGVWVGGVLMLGGNFYLAVETRRCRSTLGNSPFASLGSPRWLWLWWQLRAWP